MVQILLLILKIIGITLLIIIGIILLIFLLIMVAPFAYSLEFDYHNKFSCEGRIRWLIFVLDIDARYSDNKFIYYLKSFGSIVSTNDYVKLGRLRRFIDRCLKKSNKENNKTKNNNDTPSDIENNKKEPDVTSESKNADDIDKKNQLDVDKFNDKEDIPDNANEKKLEDKEDASQKSSENKPTINDFLINTQNKIIEAYRKVRDAIKDKIKKVVSFRKKLIDKYKELLKKIKLINNKAEAIKEILKKDCTKKCLKRIFKIGKKALKYVMPKKMKGYIHFGLEDPATTGQALGMVALGMPLYKNKIKITPDFEQKIFEGNIWLKGRVSLVYFIIIFIPLCFDKNLYLMLKDGQKILGGK